MRGQSFPGHGPGVAVRIRARTCLAQCRFAAGYVERDNTVTGFKKPKPLGYQGMGTSPSIRLLIVDDDDQLRQALVRRFQRNGLTVTEAASGESALEKTSQTRCDVALLDLNMPGMNGIELLEKLKERQPEMEVLLLTA